MSPLSLCVSIVLQVGPFQELNKQQKTRPVLDISRVAHRKRAGPKTQRTMDGNHPLLTASGLNDEKTIFIQDID